MICLTYKRGFVLFTVCLWVSQTFPLHCLKTILCKVSEGARIPFSVSLSRFLIQMDGLGWPLTRE